MFLTTSLPDLKYGLRFHNLADVEGIGMDWMLCGCGGGFCLFFYELLGLEYFFEDAGELGSRAWIGVGQASEVWTEDFMLGLE